MPDRIFGLPAWAAIATVGAAGVVAYLIFFRNQGSGSGGGSTGYSAQGLAVMQNPDESATMSAQNELLSKIGIDMQTGFGTLDTHIGQVGDSVDTGFSSVGTSLNGISGQIGGVSGQVSGVSNQVAGVSNQVSGVSTQVGQGFAADSAQLSQLSTALNNWGNSLGAGQADLKNMINGIVGQISNFQNGQMVWDNTLSQKIDYVAAIGNTYLPNIYQKVVMEGR